MIKNGDKMEIERRGDLDVPLDEFRGYLLQAVERAVELYRGLGQKRVLPDASADSMKALFDEPLPELPTGVSSLIDRVEKEVYGLSALSVGPNYYGFVTSGGNQVGVVAELLAAALDENTGKWILGPSATEIELRVVQWIAEFIGYRKDCGGVLVSGGSAANLTCLKVARDHTIPVDVRMKGMRNAPPLTVYVSSEGHSCLDKSVDELGIGRDNLRKIPVTADFTIDTEELERTIVRDRDAGFLPVCVIGNAGTVNTGAVDPMNKLADIAARHSMWFHVDAAYGGPAAATSLAQGLFAGMDRADSVATDAHKWLYAPFETGIAFVRNKELLRKAFSIIPDYLRETNGVGRHDATEYHFQLSRNFKALKLWMAFKAYGGKRLREAIEQNIRTMNHFAGLVDETPEFERLAPAPLSVVCFRYRTEDRTLWSDEKYLTTLNRKILADAENDGRVFISGTLIRGKQALRACSVNHRTTYQHVGYLLDVIREIGNKVHISLMSASTNVVHKSQ